MCLHKNIRYLRKKHEMSQEALAQILGYKSYTTIQKWESGVSEPPVKQLRKMADMFGVDINDMASVDIERQELEPSKPGYYTDPETARLAQEMFEDPDMRILYSMKRDMDPQTFRDHMEFMRKAFLREHPERGDDFDGC